MNKLLFIVGATATGKTSLAMKLAKKYNGELTSADSRQVYKGMDIGTGKDVENFKFQTSPLHMSFAGQANIKLKNNPIGYYLKDSIKIWGYDLVEPDYSFNVGDYSKVIQVIIKNIIKRGKLPIVVGGTGFYVRALIEPIETISVPPNNKLRKELEVLSVKQLQAKLQKFDNKKFSSMNNSDRNNPRRLVRAIEVAGFHRHSGPTVAPMATGAMEGQASQKNDKVLIIGLKPSREELSKRIDQRVEKRVKQGIIGEIQSLLDKGYSWDLPSMSALGYKEWRNYIRVISNFQFPISNIQKEVLKQKAIELWKLHERQYAKKQMTWFRKMKNIDWFDVEHNDFEKEVFDKVERWYTKAE